MTENTADRINQLEEQLAHQTKTIDELSGQVAGQWQVIDSLSHKLQQLTERFLAVEEAVNPPPENTKPPHW